MYNFRPNYSDRSIIMTYSENKLPGQFQNPFHAIEALEKRIGNCKDTEDLIRYYNIQAVKDFLKL